jgi:integrase/recombinase XerC
VGQVVPVNPAAAVRGPQHIVKNGKTPVLEPAEARQLLDSIDATTPAGLRDRALIALMVYSFARIGAALGMKVEDVFVQNRRLWVRLREKGGKAHAMPCHHNLEEYLAAYLDGAGLRDDPKRALFPVAAPCARQAARPQSNVSGRCPRHDPTPRQKSRRGDSDRQSQFPRDRHHGVSEEQRDT